MFGLRPSRSSTHTVEVPSGLVGLEKDYFEAFGVYPPIIPAGVTIGGLSQQIEDMRRVAATTVDQDDSMRIVREMGYLSQIHQQLLGGIAHIDTGEPR